MEEHHGVPAGELQLLNLGGVEPEAVQWLFAGYLPQGKFVVLDGDPGVGKSTLVADWVARVTTGRGWLDDVDRVPGGVVMMAGEDGVRDTLVPRLIAAGADRTRVDVVQTIRGRARVTLRDVDALERAIRATQAALLVVDPLLTFLGGSAVRDESVREVLGPVVDMAERTGCTVLGIRHFPKAVSGRTVSRLGGSGSIAIIGTARIGLIATRTHDPATRALMVAKSNVGPEPASHGYRLLDTDNGVARIEWIGELAVSPDPAAPSAADTSQADLCAIWLYDHLDGAGELAKADILADGTAQGFTERTIERAAKTLNLRIRLRGPHGSVWSLQSENPSDDQDSTDRRDPDASPPSPPRDATGGDGADQ